MPTPTLSSESPWLLTSSGRRVEILNPRPDSINIADIAHALGNIPRFTGHTKTRWSVAMHSMLVAWILRLGNYSPRVQLLGLLHDAHEAYTGDVATPLKRALALASIDGKGALKRIEDGLDRAIHAHFDLIATGDDKLAIKAADLLALATEFRDLMPATSNGLWAHPGIKPMNNTVFQTRFMIERFVDDDETIDSDLFLGFWKVIKEEYHAVPGTPLAVTSLYRFGDQPIA
jgi:uncharacterized protein